MTAQPLNSTPVQGPVEGRGVAEIRADLATCEQLAIVPWPAAARRLLTDVPSLLAEVEAAHRFERSVALEVAELVESLERVTGERDAFKDERNSALAEVRSLRGVVQAVEAQRDGALAALRQLVLLKDGPRDAYYRDKKPRAWEAARAALAAAADAPQPEDERRNDDPVRRALGQHLAYISRTVTASYPDGMDAELVMRRRVGKIWVEAGELGDAIEGWTGENPRKGTYAARHDVVKELIDCASASLCAVEFMTGDQGDSLALLAAQVASNAQRLSESIPDTCGPSPAVLPEHRLTEYGTTNCPVEGVRASVDDAECSACGGAVTA